MASNAQKRKTTQTTMTTMGFLKRKKTDNKTALETPAVTLTDFDESMLVESPLEASVVKNKESPTENLATKVNAYLPGRSSVTDSCLCVKALLL